MEWKKPVGDIMEKRKRLQVRECAHHHITPLFLYLAHLLEFVGHARLLEQFLPLWVLLHLLRVNRKLAGEAPRNLRAQLHHLRHHFIADFGRDAVGVACAHELLVGQFEVGMPCRSLPGSLQAVDYLARYIPAAHIAQTQQQPHYGSSFHLLAPRCIGSEQKLYACCIEVCELPQCERPHHQRLEIIRG